MDADLDRPILVDAHQDLAYNTLAFERDYRRAALDTRAQERRGPVPGVTGSCTIGLPELLQGRVALVFGTVFTKHARWQRSALELVYPDVETAHRQGMAQLDVYHRWADEESQFSLVTSEADLEAVLESWRGEPVSEEPDRRQVGILPLMENADPIREPAELERWVERGLRIVGPAWASNRYTAGMDEPGSLTDLGRELLERMADLGLGLDLSHMAERAALEALERYEGAVMASHSNPQAIVPGPRHLSDPLIHGIAERDGVIGIVPFNKFLRPGWRVTDRKAAVTLTDVVRAIDYVCQRVGDAEHVGLGSDFDGGFGAESVPAEIDTVADLPQIGSVLRDHGYEPKHVAAVLGGNWLRWVRRLL